MAMNLHNNNYSNLLPHYYPQVDEEAPLKKTHHRLLPPHGLIKLSHQQLAHQERLQTTKTAGASISTGLPPFAAAAVQPPAAAAAAAATTVGAFPFPYVPISLQQHHPSQFFFFLPSSAPFPLPPPYLCTPLLPEDAGFPDGFYMDSHIAAAAAPVPAYLYPPQDIDDSFIDTFVQAHNSEPGVDQVVCESYFVEEEPQQQQLDPNCLHFKQQQQYYQDGKKIIGEGLAILNIVHGAVYDELHVGSGSSGGGILIPGPFEVGEEEVVLPASLDEDDTSFVVVVPKASN